MLENKLVSLLRHDNPFLSKMNESSHVHVKDPSVFVQLWSHGAVRHSSISTNDYDGDDQQRSSIGINNDDINNNTNSTST